MERSRRSAKNHSRYLFFATVALVATLGFRTAQAQFTCTGDCNGNSAVVVNEIITLVNIALGVANVSTCPNGVRSGDTVNVTLIIQAVNNALTSTCSPPPTVTPGGGGAFCGDGNVDSAAGEVCDDGGICIGGNTAGNTCHSEADCGSTTGVCIGGEKAETVCSTTADCPNGRCQHCVAFGGDGCSANCAHETTITLTFDPASNSTVHTELFGDIPLPLTGSEQAIAGSTEVNGEFTYVVPATSVSIPTIDVGGLACACVRGVAAKSCGGTVFEADGKQALDCTDGFTAGASVCTDAGKNPCAFINGPGNASAGTIGCNGLEGANFSQTQDSRGSQDPPECLAQPGLGAPTCAADAVLTLSGHGGPGSAVVFNTQAIATVLGACSAAPAGYCTESDPFSARGTPATAPLVTNNASGEMFNINGEDGVNLGPFSDTGVNYNCATPLNVSGSALAGAFTAPNQATTGDIVVTSLIKAQ